MSYLKGTSEVNMHADANPPTRFTMKQWSKVRDKLQAQGFVMINGVQARNLANRLHTNHMAYRLSLGMNMMQEFYSQSLFVVGGIGRLTVERYLSLNGK